MLAADKLQLQSALKQQATALKEKEFQLHHSNFMTVGTQAAVLAGLDITMFIEFSPPDLAAWPEATRPIGFLLKIIYYTVIVAAFCSNIFVVGHTTVLSVMGAGLALRGPDGSMMTATDGLYEERKSVFLTFGIGLACTLGSVLVSVWLLLPWQAAAPCWMVTVYTCCQVYNHYQRVTRRFDYDESETVDFRDIMEGPAAIRGIPSGSTNHWRKNSSSYDENSSNNNRNQSLKQKNGIKVSQSGVRNSNASSSSSFWRSNSAPAQSRQSNAVAASRRRMDGGSSKLLTKHSNGSNHDAVNDSEELDDSNHHHETVAEWDSNDYDTDDIEMQQRLVRIKRRGGTKQQVIETI